MFSYARTQVPPRLEVLRETPRRSQNVNLLFVHGVSVGAWVWAEHFLKHFARLGYDSAALSLRGHGGSAGGDRVHSYSLRDFAEDVETTVAGLRGPTVLIGHSMGGAVVQYYMRRGGPAAGAALISSVPPYGLASASASMAIRRPLLWNELRKLQSGAPANIALVEQHLFSRGVSAKLRRRMMPRFREIGMRISMELSAWKRIAPLPWFAPPVFVMGGQNDDFIPGSEAAMTAAYYGVRPHIVPAASHMMMIGPEWRAAADTLHGWLQKTFAS
jgi:pimeloyl-ACP methyl ester carboxylesterase